MPIAHTIARIFKSIQQMSDMVMELQTTWDLKGLAAKIATIIQADVMIVFLSAVKNALNIVQRRTEGMTITMSILLTYNNKVQSLRRWADDMDLDYHVLYDRYRRGTTGDDLFAPLLSDTLTRERVHKLWSGRWIYKPGNPCTIRAKGFHKDKKRWVFVR